MKGTIDYGLVYQKGGDGNVTGYSDNNLAGDYTDKKFTSGLVFYYFGNAFTWCSKKQKSVALSSCEAEFMAVVAAAC